MTLLGISEIADRFGVSRQRISHLRHRLPEPLATLKCGPIWEATAIDAWAATWDRQPGRPKKETR